MHVDDGSSVWRQVYTWQEKDDDVCEEGEGHDGEEVLGWWLWVGDWSGVWVGETAAAGDEEAEHWGWGGGDGGVVWCGFVVKGLEGRNRDGELGCLSHMEYLSCFACECLIDY